MVGGSSGATSGCGGSIGVCRVFKVSPDELQTAGGAPLSAFSMMMLIAVPSSPPRQAAAPSMLSEAAAAAASLS